MSPSAHPVHPLRVLWVADAAMDLPVADGLSRDPWGPFEIERCADRHLATQRLAEDGADLLFATISGSTDDRLPVWPEMFQASLACAVVLRVPGLTPARAARLLHAGVTDVLPTDERDPVRLARSWRLAVIRQAQMRAVRLAHASDLSTGLPNEAQLLEHAQQLIALRQRQPAPLAMLVLRVDGLDHVDALVGAETVQVLRRKVAVRLRGGLRSSDIVAALGPDSFAVLLATLDTAQDALTVAAKLSTALRAPFLLAGRAVTLAVGVGVGRFPDQGEDALTLLHRAGLQASAGCTRGSLGPVSEVVPLRQTGAANDAAGTPADE